MAVDEGRINRIKAVVDGVIEPASPPKRWHRCRDLVAVILARSRDPETPLTLSGGELAVLRPGWIAELIGGTGKGKTSLAACLLLEHAKERGPAIAASLELPGFEWTARAVGTRCDASWLDVLRGHVPRQHMEDALPERLTIVDRHDASIETLQAAIAGLKAEYPGQPILTALDYVQLMPSSERDVRRQIADVMQRIDALARDSSVAILALSQGSRASSRGLADGSKIGADTTDAGAEAAELERWSSLTLAIGQHGPEAEDGTCSAEISIGKGRHQRGDRVQPARYCGRSGRWALVGVAKPAGEVRADRVKERDGAKQHAAELAIVTAAARAVESCTHDELIHEAACSKTIGRAAIRALLDRGELVEVRKRKLRAQTWQVWTRDRAAGAGLAIIEQESPCE